jgi:protease II
VDDISKKIMSDEYVAYSNDDGTVVYKKCENKTNWSLLSNELIKKAQNNEIEIIDNKDNIRIIKILRRDDNGK